MDILDHAVFIGQVIDGNVRCVDCGHQILFDEASLTVSCTTCNKSGKAKAELDSVNHPLALPDGRRLKYFATIHPIVIPEE
jgi:DNA-directed RNA polymerase subunit RPC12/RpoP